MFSKTEREKTDTSANAGAGVKAVPTIISVNLHIIGKLITDGEVQVDGSIEGDVTSRSLTVGEKASITGEINADDIEVFGSVSGNIRARKIKLAKTAKVVGDIWHEILSVETGAYIEGQLKRAKKSAERQEMPQLINVKAALVPGQSAANVQTATIEKTVSQTSDTDDKKVGVKRAAGS